MREWGERKRRGSGGKTRGERKREREVEREGERGVTEVNRDGRKGG